MTKAGFKVIRADSGKWQVLDASGRIHAECDTNAAAWRALDRLSFEPVNRSEDVHDWSSRQNDGFTPRAGWAREPSTKSEFRA